MTENIFRFERAADGSYVGTCGNVSIKVVKSYGTSRWRWELDAAADGSCPAARRDGSIRAVDAQAAQEEALRDAFGLLDGLMETGIDLDEGRALEPDEAGALQDAWELLDDCRCETA